MIIAYLNDVALPPLERDFINQNLENAADVTNLDNTLYTDFVSSDFSLWKLQWETLTQDQYDAIRAAYDAQFDTYLFPLLSIPYYSVEDVPVRMYINEKNIWNNCGSVQGVEIQFRETVQSDYVAPDYLLLNNGDRLLIGNGRLIL